MEAVLAMPSPDRGRDLVVPLSMAGVRVRTVVQSGNQMVAELGREPADCLLLPETLPDGPAEMWLTRVAAVATRRPVALVLIYGVQDGEAVRERVRSAYGPMVDVVAAGVRSAEEVAAEAARVLGRLAAVLAEQDRDAFERLQQPVAPGPVPQPVRAGGAIAFVGASGGVGTSSLVANLAAYVAMAGQRVLVVDAQFPTAGSILHYCGVEPDEHNRGMHHLRWGFAAAGGGAREGAPDELMHRLEEVRFRAVRHADLKVLHVPAIWEHMANLPVEHVTWAMRTLDREFDLVLVDCGSGLGSASTRALLEQAGRAILVAGGWGASVSALARGLGALEGQMQTDRLFLLLREAEGAFGSRTIRATVGMPIYGRVPEEPLLRKADGRLGMRVPLVVEAPDSPYAHAVGQLAFTLGLVGEPQPIAGKQKATRGWFRLVFRDG